MIVAYFSNFMPAIIENGKAPWIVEKLFKISKYALYAFGSFAINHKIHYLKLFLALDIIANCIYRGFKYYRNR